MLFVVAAVGIAVFCFTLWCSVVVARMSGIPAWRRYLPLSLFLISNAASLLRAVDRPEVANTIAFPMTLAVISISLVEIRTHRTGVKRERV
ncbi:hypothetical protein [Streptomyces yanii]|uniref:Uncharacterized protein n=1 Tax=Streptomyces yanii TaxID=78510 RepID=A0ABV5RHV4_9ACTN